MNLYVKEVQKMIKEAPKKDLNGFNPIRYMGTTHTFLGLQNKTKEFIAKNFHTAHPDLSFNELVAVLNELNMGDSFEERTIGPFILDRYKKYKVCVMPAHLDKWLNNLEGWCEIDTLCQSRFEADFLLNNWDIWRHALKQFANHKNISHRRASLVLLCRPIGKSTDQRLYNLAIENIEALKHERGILITKAIFWLLRKMVAGYSERVCRYIEENKKTLPSIAVRETRKKILTGRK